VSKKTLETSLFLQPIICNIKHIPCKIKLNARLKIDDTIDMVIERSKRLLKQAGFGLIEVMVAAAIMGGVALLFGDMLAQQAKSLQSTRTISARDDLKTRLSRYIGDSGSLNWAASTPANGGTPNPTVSATPENILFSHCVNGTTTPQCAGNTAAVGSAITATGFALTDNNGNIVANGSGYTFNIDPSGVITVLGSGGTPYYSGGTDPSHGTGPVLYDNNGAPCKPTANGAPVAAGLGTGSCGIAAFAGYYATCPSTSPCAKASTITVFYAIAQAVQSTNGATVKLASITSTSLAVKWAEVTNPVPLTASLNQGAASYMAWWGTNQSIDPSGIMYEKKSTSPSNDGIVISAINGTSLDPAFGGALPGNQFLIDAPNGTAGSANAFAVSQNGSAAIMHLGVNSSMGTSTFYDGSNGAALAFGGGTSTIYNTSSFKSGAFTETGTITSSSNLSSTTGYVYTGSAAAGCSAGDFCASQDFIANGSSYSSAFYYSSDRNLKKEIHEIDNALNKALQLRGVNFEWKKDGRKDIGVIAQEVEKVFPELVHTDAKGVKSVEYGNLTAVLIEALKQEDKKLDDMDLRLKALEKKVSAQK
jgi:prepilin-type N-terminal cleavage/methylation domain-containing protein